MEQDLYSETLFIMKKYGITANKKLGQNFLIDEFIIEDICDKAEVSSNDLIIEIGPRNREPNRCFSRKSRKSNFY